MARKKKVYHHRKMHHRMGAAGMGGIMEGVKLVLGGAMGIVGGRMVNTSMVTTSATVLGGIEFAAGVAIAAKVRHSFVKGLGIGLAGNGALYAAGAKGLNLLPASMGYAPPGGIPYRALSGYRDVPKIGFPKPGNIGALQPANLEMARTARMYAGVYN